jgi:hypothetical protein
MGKSNKIGGGHPEHGCGIGRYGIGQDLQACQQLGVEGRGIYDHSPSYGEHQRFT